MTEALRLFLGLWPDAASLRAIQAWADAQTWPDGARRSAPQHLHLTLHFLGATAPEAVAPLCAALPTRIAPMALRLDRLEHWHDGLVVLSPSAAPDALLALHAALGGLLRAQGLPTEPRPFRPHLTLARRAAGLRAPPPALHWNSRALVLAQSLRGYHALWQAKV